MATNGTAHASEMNKMMNGAKHTNGTMDMNGTKEMNGNMNGTKEMNGNMNGTKEMNGHMNGTKEMNGKMNGTKEMNGNMNGTKEMNGNMNGRKEMNGTKEVNGTTPAKAKCNILSGPEELKPTPEIPLGRYIVNKLKSHGDKVAMIDAASGDSATFAAILSRSLSVAESLRMRGVKAGDVIGVCSENRIEFCLPAIGSLILGAACAPLNPIYTTRELIHTMSISKPSVVFCSPQSLVRLLEVCKQVASVRELVVFSGEDTTPATPATPAVTPFSALLQHTDQGLEGSFEELEGNDRVASIFCSSGTTGLPKGVMTTDRNVLTGIQHMCDPRFGALRKDQIQLLILPFFHVYGYSLILASLAAGMQLVIFPRFGEEIFLKSIQNHKVNLMFLVPPLMLFLAKHPLVDKYDLTSLEVIWCAAAPLSPVVQEQVAQRLKVEQIRQGYGATETTLGVLITPPTQNKVGSSGMLVPSTQCKVSDMVTGEALGPNCNGELCFRGPLMMKGYCDNQAATDECFDDQGFLRTGDIAYYDQDGFFFIVGRLKELIKYKGNQVPPAELEAVLLTHPSIKDAGVIGIPDEEAGELPMAFVVLQPGKALSAEEVTKFIAGQVSPAKRLRGGVRFVDSIPKNPSGKILRRELAMMAQQ